MFRFISALVASAIFLAQPISAWAEAKIRIEYVRLLRGGDEKTPATQLVTAVVGSATTVTAAGASVQSSAAPTFAPDRQYSGGVYARITPILGAGAVVVGENPTATDAAGLRVEVGQAPIYMPITAGQKVALIEAVDAPVGSPLSPDQDPIYDHANGVRATVTTSTVVFTPAAGVKFARFDASSEAFIRTDNAVAADDGQAVRLIADSPDILPVTPGVPVRAYAASSATLRITPMKVR